MFSVKLKRIVHWLGMSVRWQGDLMIGWATTIATLLLYRISEDFGTLKREYFNCACATFGPQLPTPYGPRNHFLRRLTSWALVRLVGIFLLMISIVSCFVWVAVKAPTSVPVGLCSVLCVWLCIYALYTPPSWRGPVENRHLTHAGKYTDPERAKLWLELIDRTTKIDYENVEDAEHPAPKVDGRHGRVLGHRIGTMLRLELGRPVRSQANEHIATQRALQWVRERCPNLREAHVCAVVNWAITYTFLVTEVEREALIERNSASFAAREHFANAMHMVPMTLDDEASFLIESRQNF